MTSPAVLASGAAFALPALALFVPSGYSWGALLLLLAGLTGWRQRLNPSQWPLELKAWALTVLGMAIIWGMHLFNTDTLETRTLGLDRSAKYVLALLALPAMLIGTRWPRALATGCWVGAALAGLIALRDVFYLQLPRAEGHTNAIHFGNIALLLTCWAALWTLQTRSDSNQSSPLWPILGGTTCALGMTAVVLSGSRGGWMALPVLGALLAWQWKHNRPHPTPQRTPSALPWVLVIGFSGLLVLNTPVLHQRIEKAHSEWAGWMQTGESNNSVGQRLAHWQFAWNMFLERPAVGWGQAAYDTERLKAIDDGRAPEPMRHFNHAHNEWLDMAAKRGVVGVLGLVALLGVPGWLYSRKLRSTHHRTTRTLALCGLATVLGYGVFGLTQVMFAHNAGNMMYLFMNTLWLGALAQTPPGTAHD